MTTDDPTTLTLIAIGTTLASAGVGAASAAGAFSSKAKAPTIPGISDAETRAAAEQERLRRASSAGRSSTIFTNLAAESVKASSPYDVASKSTLG